MLRTPFLLMAFAALALAGLACFVEAAPLESGSFSLMTWLSDPALEVASATATGSEEASPGKHFSDWLARSALLNWHWESKEASSDADNGQSAESEEDGPIKTDRPTFTPSSSTVGKHIQLETGYTFTQNRTNGLTSDTHSYPEANLRFGLGADWLEGRLGQNVRYVTMSGFGATPGQSGAEDLFVGIKVATTKQSGWLPETAVILQTSVPTGSEFLTQKTALPGIIGIYTWEVIKDRLSVSGSFQVNQRLSGTDHVYTELAQSLYASGSLSKKLSVYGEYYALYPSGSDDPEIGPRHTFNTGILYLLTNNLQLDWRVGAGLNRHADDFFTGVGLSFRF